jgi:hypothetical protein
MNLFEFFSPEPYGFYSGGQDQSILKKEDTRKTRLTIDQLNRLRIMNDIRKLEYEKSIDGLATQYGPPAQPAGPGLM